MPPKKKETPAPAPAPAPSGNYNGVRAVNTLNRATGVVMTGKSQVLKHKPLYPTDIAPIKPARDPLAKKVTCRPETVEKHSVGV